LGGYDSGAIYIAAAVIQNESGMQKLQARLLRLAFLFGSLKTRTLFGS